MQKHSCKLITIVTESVLEAGLCQRIKDLGASGYTVTNARGSGSRGVRTAGWASNSNIRIEVICSDSTAQRIIDCMHEHYYADYAMVLFESDVKVIRPNKF